MVRLILFFFSGTLSFLVYFLLLFSLFISLSAKKTPKYSAETLLSVNVMTMEDLEVNIKEDSPKEKSEDEKEDTSQGVLEGAGINDVFSQIDSKKSPPDSDKLKDDRATTAKNKKIDTSKKVSKDFSKDSEDIKKRLSRIATSSIDMKGADSQVSSSEQYNEWFADIQKLIYSKWNASSYYENATINALVTIRRDGSFSYRVLKYSNVTSFNFDIKAVLDSLKEDRVPPPVGKDSVDIEVIFKTEGNGNV